ncbi:hypothetical protein AAG906_005119 [Vitis piasezkii]
MAAFIIFRQRKKKRVLQRKSYRIEPGCPLYNSYNFLEPHHSFTLFSLNDVVQLPLEALHEVSLCSRICMTFHGRSPCTGTKLEKAEVLLEGVVKVGFWFSGYPLRARDMAIPLHRRGTRATISGILERIQEGFATVSERIQSWRKSLKLKSPRKKILDPRVRFFRSGIKYSSSLLYLQLPWIHFSFTSQFFIARRPALIWTRNWGHCLCSSPSAIAKRYLSTYFIIDILSILPSHRYLVILIVKAEVKGPVSLTTKDLLKSVIFSQYVPRLLRIYPLYKEVTTTSGIITQTAWAGAVFNLCLYMLASHVVGAFWYLFAIERQNTCWVKGSRSCGFNPVGLYCGAESRRNNITPQVHDCLNAACPLIDPDDIVNSTTFNFGMFFDALQSHVVERKDFQNKFFYCFWWGLRNLSSLGQNLKTSTFIEEIFFAVFISIFGLVLFSLLIGNMQKYLQSTTVRIEEMRVKRQDAEQWMAHRLLPDHLRVRIRRYEQYKWQETRGVQEHKLISDLPKDLRRVPMFEKMDSQLLDALCDHLKPVLYTENSTILREGDPVDEIFFIMRGKLSTITTNGGRTGFFNETYLKAGDFCGDELLTWALESKSSSNLPISTRTVRAITEVEAFGLMSNDLITVASQFFYRLHSKQLQYTFRFYSQQWRTWGACFIQAAWQRYRRRKQDKALQEAEERLQDALSREVGASPSLGATVFASRFAAKLLRALRRNGGRRTRLPQRLPPLMPQKPTDPDFTSAAGATQAGRVGFVMNPSPI